MYHLHFKSKSCSAYLRCLFHPCNHVSNEVIIVVDIIGIFPLPSVAPHLLLFPMHHQIKVWHKLTPKQTNSVFVFSSYISLITILISISNTHTLWMPSSKIWPDTLTSGYIPLPHPIFKFFHSISPVPIKLIGNFEQLPVPELRDSVGVKQCSRGVRLACWHSAGLMSKRLWVRIMAEVEGIFFLSIVNFVCWLLFGVHSTPVILQWQVKDPSYSAKSVDGRLHLNTHTPLT